MSIQLNKEDHDQFLVTITGQVSAADIDKTLNTLINGSEPSVRFVLRASHATEYLIVQLLAILRKAGKSISVEWVDHEPSIIILSIIESVIK